MLALTVLGIILLSLTVSYFKSLKYRVWQYKKVKEIPGPPALNPIIGNLHRLQGNPDKIYELGVEFARKYTIYNMTTMHLASVCILLPEDFELVLSNSKHNEKSWLYNTLHDWLGTGLLTSKGNKWLTRRKILTQAFHFSILQQFITVFNEQAEKLVENLKKECNKPYVEITSHVSQFTLKTIAETAMGIELKFNTEKEINYKNSILEIGKILLYRLLHPWFLFSYINIFSPNYSKERKLIKSLHNFTKEVINEREKNFKEIDLPSEKDEVYTGKRRLAMLDLLLSAKNKDKTIDYDGVREEVDTFMFEGHDTTASALGFALLVLASHKNVQEKIIEEMDAVLGDLFKKPTYNDFQEMKYLERTIKEVLRMYPSVPFMSRKLGAHITSHSGYLIPKDTMCHLIIYNVHYNPKIYPDPEKFDPDRFLPENCQKRHPFAYVPFSAGPRNCIGQKFAMLELKAALCGILANFILEPVDTPDSIVLVADLVMRTKENIKVKLVSRI